MIRKNYERKVEGDSKGKGQQPERIVSSNKDAFVYNNFLTVKQVLPGVLLPVIHIPRLPLHGKSLTIILSVLGISQLTILTDESLYVKPIV